MPRLGLADLGVRADNETIFDDDCCYLEVYDNCIDAFWAGDDAAERSRRA